VTAQCVAAAAAAVSEMKAAASEVVRRTVAVDRERTLGQV
jgi:hypothetical protein